MRIYQILAIIFTISFSNIYSSDLSAITSTPTKGRGWMSFSQNEDYNIKKLLFTLNKSETGRLLIKHAKIKAFEHGKDIFDIIEAGNGSLTDTTLIRRFHRHNPFDVSYQTQSKIFINRDLKFEDAVLDLAHELTHFIYRDEFNPYTNKLNLGEFILNTIEGKGGEIQAFMSECKVLVELWGAKKANTHCSHIHLEQGDVASRLKAKKLFYRLGNYYTQFNQMIKSKNISHLFPYISDKQVIFYSSAYSLPYPLASIDEYVTVSKKVCENDMQRLSFYEERNGRSIASIGMDTQSGKHVKLPRRQFEKFRRDYNRRCKSYMGKQSGFSK